MDPSETLQTYIENRLAQGASDSTISQELKQAGWSAHLVQQALIEINRPKHTKNYTHEQGMFNGRLSRLGYIMAMIYIAIYFIILTLLLSAFRHSTIEIVLTLLLMISSLALIPIMISIHIRRWHDLDKPGSLTVLSGLPPIAVIVLVFFLFAPGSYQTNKYGTPFSFSMSPLKVFGFSS
jgi:uncharacterized membrane protein YhaH (DUF805 family)